MLEKAGLEYWIHQIFVFKVGIHLQFWDLDKQYLLL